MQFVCELATRPLYTRHGVSVPGERNTSDMTSRRPALTVFSFLVVTGALAARCEALVVWHTAGPSYTTHQDCLQHQTTPRQVVAGKKRSRPPRFSTSHMSVGGRSTQLSARGDDQALDSRSRARPLTTGLGRRRASPAVVSLGAASGAGGGNDGQGGVEEKQELSRQAKLWISIMIDLVGVSSYALPGLGELTDLGWAPISAALIYYLYGSSVFAGLAFVEEIVPGFDIIPTATIAWFLTNSELGKNVSSVASRQKAVDPKSKAASPPPPPSNVASSSSAARRGVVDLDEASAGVVVDVECE